MRKLAGFNAWLIANVGAKPNTRNTYRYAIRRLLRNVELTDVQGRDANFEQIPPELRGPYRAAWRAFVAYSADQGVALTPLPQDTGDGPPQPQAHLPVEVVQAIHAILDVGVAPRTLANLTWEAVRPFEVTVQGVVMRALQQTVAKEDPLVPASALAVLRTWGRPVGMGAPLIPKTPGSLQALPVAQYPLRD